MPYASYAENILEGVDSVIEESIDDAVQVQLIDAKFENISYFSISFIGPDNVIQSVTQYYKYRGYQFIAKDFPGDYHTVIVKLPDDELEGVLEESINTLRNNQFNFLRFTVLGSINQQRVLGNINRIYSNAALNVAEKVESGPGQQLPSNNTLQLPYPFATKDKEKEKKLPAVSRETSLLTAFILCRFEPTKVPAFIVKRETVECSRSEFQKMLIVDDKYVANYKSDLLQRLEFVDRDPFEWLELLASFTSEDSFEEFTQFYSNLPAVSIEDVVALYKRYNVNFESAPQQSISLERVADLKMSQSFMESFDVDSYELKSRGDYYGVTVTVSSADMCTHIDCKALPYYATAAQSAQQGTISFTFLPQQSAQVIGEIVDKVIAPLAKVESIRQGDVMLAFNGNFAIGDLEKVFFGLGQLPATLKLDVITPSHYQKIDIAGSSSGLNIPAVPGDQDWASSELLYFKLLTEAANGFEVYKDNSVIALQPAGFFNVNRERTVLTFQAGETGVEHLKAIQQMNDEEFTALKQGLLNNVVLQDNEYQIALLSEVFALENYKQQLSFSVTDLSLNEFKLFAQRLLETYSK